MPKATDDFSDHDDRPTEEIYIELRDLEAVAPGREDTDDPVEPRPVTASDDPTGIRARIAKLRALLSDRGAPYDR